MRVTVIAIGTRGDVHPALALAGGLRAAGHRVRFATEKGYARQAAGAGFEYYELSGDSAKFYGGRAGTAFRESVDGSAAKFDRFMQSYIAPGLQNHLREAAAACEDADLLVSQPTTGLGPSLGEKLGVPCVIASVFPLPELPTKEFPYVFSRQARDGLTPEENCRTWRRALPFLRPVWRVVQRWRAGVLGLRAQTFRGYVEHLRRTPHVFGYSPFVVPKPADWGGPAEVTGFWFLETAAGYEPPAELEEFLAGGEPPVAVGFGSHVARDPGPAKLTDMALDALRSSGQRGIILTGWGGMKNLAGGDGVFYMPGVPHDWLLPRVRALVHHGGSGTTGIALRTGVPQVIVPFGFDQTFWGYRVSRLGVGSHCPHVSSLTAEWLAAAIRGAATDDSVRGRAAEVGRELRAEDGVAAAVAATERYASSGRDACARC